MKSLQSSRVARVELQSSTCGEEPSLVNGQSQRGWWLVDPSRAGRRGKYLAFLRWLQRLSLGVCVHVRTCEHFSVRVFQVCLGVREFSVCCRGGGGMCPVQLEEVSRASLLWARQKHGSTSLASHLRACGDGSTRGGGGGGGSLSSGGTITRFQRSQTSRSHLMSLSFFSWWLTERTCSQWTCSRMKCHFRRVFWTRRGCRFRSADVVLHFNSLSNSRL